jgi:hypothetical protein
MNHDEKVEELRDKIRELRDELRTHAQQVEDPRCAALCETSAEVAGGLEMAFDHYLNKSEVAWQEA